MKKWKLVVLIAVCVILVAVPGTMMLASGEFFPKQQEDYNIAIILPSTDLHGLYVSQSLVGAQQAIKESAESDEYRPVTVDLYKINLGNDSEYQRSLRKIDLAIDQYDLIYGPSYSSLTAMYELAEDNPDIQFLLMDNTVTSDVTNIANISFLNEEVSFVTGYLAGMTTNTNKVGFLGGVSSQTISQFYYGYLAGVKLAEVERGVNIAVDVEYVESYVDQEKGYELSAKMYDNGADIVFTVAGDSGLGGIQAAVDRDKYVIGVDVDQNVEAPNNVIFSAVKNIADEAKDVLLSYAKGDGIADKNLFVGYADGALSTVSYLKGVVPESAQENAEILERAIASGKITVPGTEEDMAKWNVYEAQAVIKYAS